MPSTYLTWLVRDRERFGFTAAQVAGHLGVVVRCSGRNFLKAARVFTRRIVTSCTTSPKSGGTS